MTQREKIVDHVSQMILSLGVKSVRMDDVANSLGMSKRTLYEMFADKEELLFESIVYLMECRQQNLSEQMRGCDNMLEVLLYSVRIFTSTTNIDDTAKRLTTNLRKFYPTVLERVQRVHTEKGLAGLQYALDRCLAEGYLDPNVDVELMAQLFFSSTGIFMTDSNVVLPDGITRDEAFGAMVVNFLRGLSTVKGLQVIDDILAREPRPKTLKERRAEANAENN
ncbi:MAG: TetR/AcrR family transcriptional regulator [Rikenellaceae bacterium]|nr:TetR/AcrR family transcriptional regulator [Rikenellaceae bacterium]